MSWEKKGLIFAPNNEFEWMMTHAQVPTVYPMQNCFRIFFATRNPQGKSLTACMDVARHNPTQILQLYPEPVLNFGKPGTFDDDGVMPSFVYEYDNKLLLYYSGWNQRTHVPYHNATGLAVSFDQGMNFTRVHEGPILDRITTEPYLAVTPCILHEGNQWQMWYVSGLKWELVNGKYEPIYVIKYAHSVDGINWQRPNITCIPQHFATEAFSHPNVLKIDGIYHMWYCYRASHDYRDGAGSYRMGYAQSPDGINWQRQDDKAGITTSLDGWDSKMVCYPYIIRTGNELIMFYNGNGFGKSGFGYAIKTLACQGKTNGN